MAERPEAARDAVIQAAQKLKFGAYPAHGSGFITIVVEGDVGELEQALARLRVECQESGGC